MGQIPQRESAEPLAHAFSRDGAQRWSLNAAILSNAGWLGCTCRRDPGDTAAAAEIATRIASVSRKGCDIK